MKKIGFIDYFMSEWHANSYPEWIRDNIKAHNRDMQLAYAYSEKEVSPIDNIKTDEWCAKFKMQKLGSIKELMEKSDYVFILSPDNPERHLDMAKQAFILNRPIYMDKTFATSKKEAKEIFELAKARGTKLFSSSALRFSDELEDFKDKEKAADFVITSGPSTFENYSIHQIEMIITCLQAQPKGIVCLKNGKNRILRIDFSGGKQAYFNQLDGYSLPFSVNVVSGELCEFRNAGGNMFQNLIHNILNFFEDGITKVDPSETIAVMSVIEAGKEALLNVGKYIEIGE